MASGKKGKASRVVVWFILLLLIVGLAGFGATNFGGTVNSIGKVGDTPIDVTRYARALQQQINAISQQTGQNLTLAQAQQFGLDQAVLQQLIGTVALENEAKILGLSVGDEQVRNQVLQIPAFQGVDGKFSRENYRFALEQSGLKESAFEATLRAEVARTMIQGAVASGVIAPKVLVDTILTFIAERRSFDWVALGVDDLAGELPVPGDADLRSYYDANTSDFMLPETRAITYAWLTPAMIIDKIDVDEDALRKLYEDRKAEFVKPERRLVERLIFGTLQEAQAAKAALDSGEKEFDDLVAERDLTLADVDMGDVTREDLDEAGDAVFALEGPGIAGPVETDLGPALYRMNGILQAQETTFEEARADLLDEYVLDRARREIGGRIESVDDLLAGGASLEDLAKETDLELGKIDWTADSSDGIAAYEEFRAAAASAAKGDFPEVLELEDGGIFALRIDEITPARPEPFEDAKARVQAAWVASETAKALAEQARALADQLKSGVDPADLGLTLTPAADITRESFIPETSADFLDQVFQMSEGEIRVIEGETAAYLVRLNSIAPPDTTDPDIAKRTEGFANATAQAIGADMLDAYTRAIQTRAGISLNQAAINAVHANFR